MTSYLLDTDAVVDYLKGVASTVDLVARLTDEGHQLCLCDVVVCEVHAGLTTSRQRSQAEQLLSALEYLPTSRSAAGQAGNWRSVYRARGVQLTTTDCMIAAIAHEHRARLVTANLRDFPMSELTVLPLPRARQDTT